MTKTFCDRCGKEITKEYGWITHRTLYACIRLFPGKNHAEWSELDDRYICPECEDSYIHWFMNPNLALQKKQEPIHPEKENDGTPEPCTSWWYVCGDCGQEIEYHDRFCRWCGRAIKWE